MSGRSGVPSEPVLQHGGLHGSPRPYSTRSGHSRVGGDPSALQSS